MGKLYEFPKIELSGHLRRIPTKTRGAEKYEPLKTSPKKKVDVNKNPHWKCQYKVWWKKQPPKPSGFYLKNR